MAKMSVQAWMRAVDAVRKSPFFTEEEKAELIAGYMAEKEKILSASRDAAKQLELKLPKGK